MISPNKLILRVIEGRNGLDLAEDTEKFKAEFFREREKLTMMIDKCDRSPDGGKIKFQLRELYDSLEKLILASRMETGVSTLSFFIYSILSGIAGIIMEVLALLSTVGFIGHVILSISIAGGVGGIIFALYSMKRERQFMISIRNII